MQDASTAGKRSADDLDALIVGAGFSGIYMSYKLHKLGFSLRVLEAGSEIGGTWFWNRYPGARCDSESEFYCYSFMDELLQEWTWNERFPSQAEILSYLNFAADRLDVRRHIQLDTFVKAATFDDRRNRWVVETAQGEVVTARYLVLGVGILTVPNIPKFKGLESFRGDWHHTSLWPHDGVDFAGKRVGIVGTGSSGVQTIPEVAKQASHLYVFQRTPAFVLPAGNAPMDQNYMTELKANYAELFKKARASPFGMPYTRDPRSAFDVTDEERDAFFEDLWQKGGNQFLRKSFWDVVTDKKANDTVVNFVHRKIRETVKDPETARALMAQHYPIGTKRVCAGTNFYETFNRDNVSLVDVRNDPIQEVTADGIRTKGAYYALDSLILATGFDAGTGTILNIDLRGKDGLSLKQKWAQGPQTYLGLMTAGFPNLFTITGPQSPSALANVPTAIEQHVEWISDCLEYLRDHDLESIEATEDAERQWIDHCNEVAAGTLFPKVDSWYTGANIPGKPKAFMVYIGGLDRYGRKCDDVASKGYEGFTLA